MSESSVTKKVISEGFKKTMSKKPFEKITISDITSECGLNRQTFYYHFQDKYELLNWIFYNDVVSPFKDDFTIENWSEQLLHILRILKENSKFYANAINTPYGNEFRKYFFSVIVKITDDILAQITEGYSINGENMNKRILAIGPVTKDYIITPQEEYFQIGGAVFYQTLTLTQLKCKVSSIISIANEDTKFLEDIDADNTKLEEDDLLDIIDKLKELRKKEIQFSKYQAYTYLNIGRATFDNLVREGNIPRGKKVQGFKELRWYKKDLDKYLKELNK